MKFPRFWWGADSCQGHQISFGPTPALPFGESHRSEEDLETNLQRHSIAGTQQQRVFGNAKPGIFFYLFEVQTSHYSSWVWRGQGVKERKTYRRLPSWGSSKLRRGKVPPEEVSIASGASRGIGWLPASFLKHRATRTFPLQLLHTLWKITGTGFYTTATHTRAQKKPATPHVITPSEKTSRNGLCWASWTHRIMREQNICRGSSCRSLPAQHYSKILKFTAKCYLEFLWRPE